MGFSKDQGYIPVPIDEMMADVMARLNTNFSISPPYTMDTFVGTNMYKYFYAMIQRLQENEIKTSEIVAKVQSYFRLTNESLARPNTTIPGMIDYFKTFGFDVTIKPPIEAEAGELRVAVDMADSDDDFEEKSLEFATLLKNCQVAGTTTIGTETETITLSNGQSFDFNFNLSDRIPILLRLTIVTSENNEFAIEGTQEIAQKLFDNVNARYHFGLNFEPQRYFSVADAPWAATVLLEYSTNAGADWSSSVADLDYDQLYTFDLEDISVVES